MLTGPPWCSSTRATHRSESPAARTDVIGPRAASRRSRTCGPTSSSAPFSRRQGVANGPPPNSAPETNVARPPAAPAAGPVDERPYRVGVSPAQHEHRRNARLRHRVPASRSAAGRCRRAASPAAAPCPPSPPPGPGRPAPPAAPRTPPPRTGRTALPSDRRPWCAGPPVAQPPPVAGPTRRPGGVSGPAASTGAHELGHTGPTNPAPTNPTASGSLIGPACRTVLAKINNALYISRDAADAGRASHRHPGALLRAAGEPVRRTRHRRRLRRRHRRRRRPYVGLHLRPLRRQGPPHRPARSMEGRGGGGHPRRLRPRQFRRGAAALWRNFADPPSDGGWRWLQLEHELWLHATRHPEARRRLADRYERVRAPVENAVRHGRSRRRRTLAPARSPSPDCWSGCSSGWR